MRRSVPLVAAIFVALGIANADVIVPGKASGGFGSPSDQMNPLIPALTVAGPAVIQITATGCLTDVVGPACITPDGFSFTGNSAELTPLQEAGVFPPPTDPRTDGLMDALVPATIANQPTFQAIDSRNPACHPGPCIDPGLLSPIGTNNFLIVQQAGTLFLGIDDFIIGDNGGRFDVSLRATNTVPEPGTLSLFVGLSATVLVVRLRRVLRSRASEACE